MNELYVINHFDSITVYVCSVNIFLSLSDVIKEQAKELRGTQRQITRDRAALEKQEKQMVRHTHTHHSPYEVLVGQRQV